MAQISHLNITAGDAKNLGKPVLCVFLSINHPKFENDARQASIITTGSKNLGLLYFELANLSGQDQILEDRLDLLHEFADQAAIALTNAQSYEMTNIDKLTGLYLRPFFEAHLEKRLRLSQKSNETFTIMLIEIDSFKKINDEYGYQVSDNILKILGRLLRQTSRVTDIQARYSTEKLAVILPSTTVSQAKDAVTRLIVKLQACSFPCNPVTISIGIANYPAHFDQKQPLQKNRLIDYAEQALISAQKMGGNCHVIWNKNLAENKHVRIAVTDILTANPIIDYRNIEMLLTTINALSSTLNAEELLARIIEIMLGLTEADQGLLLLIEENSREIMTQIAKNKGGEDITNVLTCNQSIVDRVMESGTAICLNETVKKTSQNDKTNSEQGYVICIPLQTGGKRLGVIYLECFSSPLNTGNKPRDFAPDLTFLQALGSQIAGAIETIRLHEKELSKDRISRELILAGQILQDLLPTEAPQVGGIRLSGRMKTAKAVGMDYYDFALADDRSQCYIIIGNVSGSGITSSLFLAQLQTMFRYLAAQKLSTKEILVRLNKILDSNSPGLDEPMALTLLLMCWDCQKKEIRYTSAGHEFILTYRHKTKSCQMFKTEGMWLGTEKSIDLFIEEKVLPVDFGDMIMLYSDGLIEYRNQNEEMFQLQHLTRFVEENGDNSPENIIDRLFETLVDFSGETPQRYDATAIAIKIGDT